MSLEKLRTKIEKINKSFERSLPEIVVDVSIRTERLSICESCEKFNPKIRNCRMCGCFMDLKTWLPKQKCPMNKWGVVTVETPDEK